MYKIKKTKIARVPEERVSKTKRLYEKIKIDIFSNVDER